MALTNEDLQAIAGLLQPIQDDVQGLRSDVQKLKADVQTLKKDQAKLRNEQNQIKTDLEAQIRHTELALRAEIRSSENLIIDEVTRVHHILEKHMQDNVRHSA